MGDELNFPGGRAFVVKAGDGKAPVSMKMEQDPFAAYYGDGILEPPYDLGYLARLPECSNILSQCVEAMEVNIDGFGFGLDPIGGADPEGDGVPIEAAEAERKAILHFFEFCNPDMPYSQLRRRVRRDLETLGNGYWEIIRDGKGDIAWIEHIEGHTMRLTRLDDEYTPVTLLIRDDESNELRPYEHRKRFRRFVQIRDGLKVYFKEFGDPRLIDARTGRLRGEEEVGEFTPATEVIHFRFYSPSSPYGVPRWIGNLLAVLGSRQAEEVNYEYFENNTIPPLALLVAGTLGEKTVERIEDFIHDHMRGRQSFNKMLVIEASPAGTIVPGMTAAPKTSIQFQHLSDAQQKDSLFDNYDRTNREKIRSSFRLPPIFVGLTSDYTRATARESREVAEEQVFAPERGDHDFIINRVLFPAMGVRYWKYRSLAPTSNDSEIMAGVLDSFCRCGMTVREARDEISRLLNRPLTTPEGEEPEWLDLPMSIYLAQLQHGGGEGEPGPQGELIQKGAPDREALFLRALTGIEKALEEEHEHGDDTDEPDPSGTARGLAEARPYPPHAAHSEG